jgi:chromate transport protein ChrA
MRPQYQELFAVSQALPGPGSTKMLFGLNVIRGGFLIGVLSFFIWRCVVPRKGKPTSSANPIAIVFPAP